MNSGQVNLIMLNETGDILKKKKLQTVLRNKLLDFGSN